MNKKYLIFLIIVILIIVVFILVINAKNKKVNNSEAVYHVETPNDGSTTTFTDEEGNKYRAIYNSIRRLYEIFDENDNIIATAQDETDLRDYIFNPNLMFVVNDSVNY